MEKPTKNQGQEVIPADLESEIFRLKKERNAVILAHYYQESEIQEIADFVGDSLELSRKAASTDAGVIVFAGVQFMAETAKILSPQKKVIVPDPNAGCSLAEGCPAPLFKEWREAHEGYYAITYINCSAEVKAMSDIICTSSNAEKIINQVPDGRKILFAPDRNLGNYLKKKTGRDLTIWQGSCVVHETFSLKKLLRLKSLYPDAVVIAHPECEEPVLEESSFIGSTSALLRHIAQSTCATFIVATETGIIHQMEKAAPGKTFIPAPPEENCACNQCPYMKLNTMEKLYLCLRDQSPEILLPDELIARAIIPLTRMMEIG